MHVFRGAFRFSTGAVFPPTPVRLVADGDLKVLGFLAKEGVAS